MVMPCLCCPPSPELTSPVCTCGGWPRAWTASWEQVEGALVIVLLTALLWGTMWAAMGAAAGPMSYPFVLLSLSLAAHAMGVVLSATIRLPHVYGMILIPAVVNNLHFPEHQVAAKSVGEIILFASVTVFLVRAGLEVELSVMRDSSGLILALGFLPLCAEMAFVAVAGSYALAIPWRWGFLLGAVTSPVSPLVVMQGAMRQRGLGLELQRGTDTLVLAVSMLDGSLGLCLSSLAFAIAVVHKAFWTALATSCLQLGGGIFVGVIAGFILIYVPNEENAHVTFYRAELMVAVSVFGVILFHYFWGLTAMGYLSVFTMACVASNGWTELGIDSSKDDLRLAMSLVWLILQPIGMTIAGEHVVFFRFDWRVRRYLGVLFAGLVIRFVVSGLCTLRSERPWRQRLFLCLSLLPKGAIQFVAGAWVLEGLEDPEEERMARMVLACGVCALVATGPAAAVLANWLGPAVLRYKTKAPAPPTPSPRA